MASVKRDTITQGELSALKDEEEAVREALKALRGKFSEILARVKAGAKVQRGFYRVVEETVLGHRMGHPSIVDRTYQPMDGEKLIEHGR